MVREVHSDYTVSLQQIYIYKPPFFFIISDVIQMLETNGRVTIKEGTSELLKLPLRCHVCRRDLPTIPSLKEHLKSHFSS